MSSVLPRASVLEDGFRSDPSQLWWPQIWPRSWQFSRPHGAESAWRQAFDLPASSLLSDILANPDGQRRIELVQLRRALESARLGTWEWDVQSNRVRFDATSCEICGIKLPVDTWVATDGTDALAAFEGICADFGHARHSAIDDMLYQGASGYDTEFCVRQRDGSITWIGEHAEVVTTEPILGLPLRIVGVVRDLTAQKEAEAALGGIDRSTASQELVDIAFGFNNLLSVILHNANIQRASAELRGDKKTGVQARMMERAAERGASLAARLMACARAETPQLNTPRSTEAEAYEPAKLNSASAEASVLASLEANDVSRRRSVLVVEDEEDLRDTVSEVLEGAGYHVLKAEDAHSARRILESNEPLHMLFSDIILPGGVNGVELARQARLLRQDIRVILTSGHSADILKRHGAETEFKVFTKPYRGEELVRTIGAQIGLPASAGE